MKTAILQNCFKNDGSIAQLNDRLNLNMLIFYNFCYFEVLEYLVKITRLQFNCTANMHQIKSCGQT